MFLRIRKLRFPLLLLIILSLVCFAFSPRSYSKSRSNVFFDVGANDAASVYHFFGMNPPGSSKIVKDPFLPPFQMNHSKANVLF